MHLSKTTFWEYNINSLNQATDFYTIIPRIAMRGTYDEWLEMRKQYGDKKILEVLKQERYLDKKTLRFVSSLYDIPQTEFRCYTERRLHPQPWNY